MTVVLALCVLAIAVSGLRRQHRRARPRPLPPLPPPPPPVVPARLTSWADALTLSGARQVHGTPDPLLPLRRWLDREAEPPELRAQLDAEHAAAGTLDTVPRAQLHAAIASLQRELGVTPDGLWGERTSAAWYAAGCPRHGDVLRVAPGVHLPWQGPLAGAWARQRERAAAGAPRGTWGYGATLEPGEHVVPVHVAEHAEPVGYVRTGPLDE